MPSESQMKEFVRALNQIPWEEAAELTPEAEALMEEHVRRMRQVVEHARAAKDLPPPEAYARAQSAGYDAPDYDAFMHMLFNEVDFRGARYRWHLILGVAAYYFWKDDRDYGRLENPWEPMFELYKRGYASTFDEDLDAQTVDVMLSYADEVKSYRLA
jgi:hypothetical protein